MKLSPCELHKDVVVPTLVFVAFPLRRFSPPSIFLQVQ